MAISSGRGLRIGVIGTGVSGLAAAWLLSRVHEVTVFEQATRIGGHSNTVEIATPGRPVCVDTGFIVYNPTNYPNLSALFEHLATPTRTAEMSFAVSRRGGDLEYAGTSLSTLFAQRRNLVRPTFWSMLADIRRFYRFAPGELNDCAHPSETLGAFLDRRGYGTPFRDDHLLPMAAAIWSSPAATMLDCPAQTFVRFFDNHGLLKLRARPEWRTIIGGSQAYVRQLTLPFADRIRKNVRVVEVVRGAHGVTVTDQHGNSAVFDHVIIATHADQALSLLREPSSDERRLLGSFSYTQNRAVLHSDASLMPRRRMVWSSWNYVEDGAPYPGDAQVTYWMNWLQGLPGDRPLFVTLNPRQQPNWPIHDEIYAHPTFDVAAVTAQSELWSLQGRRNTWFCGAYFGAGFHEDGLQAGLAVAEDLGDVRRPWTVDGEFDRIVRTKTNLPARRMEFA